MDPLAEETPGWTPYHYVHNNPIKFTDPFGLSADSTRIYNTIGAYQFTINDNLPNEDHFLPDQKIKQLCKMGCASDNEEASLFRANSDFFIGSNTRSQLSSIQSNHPGEAGFLLYPGVDRELQVHDITNLGESTANQFRVDIDDIKISSNPSFYNLIVGGGHTHLGDSSPSPPGFFNRLSDYSPMLKESYNSQPSHLLIVAGKRDFTIYSSAQRTLTGDGHGWNNSFPGRTSTKIKYNGNK